MVQENDKQPRVLIVDDIAENIQVLGNILDEKDIEFSYATDGREALEAVSYSKPDLILLDVNMPGMSGFEVCKKLKEGAETKEIPVIFLTAKTEPEDIIEGFTIGGVDYITKPFNSKEMISRVETHLELSMSRQMIASRNHELDKLNAELKEIVASKDKFFSIIAHDLKEPFNTMIGFSDLLLKTIDQKKPAQIKEMVRHIFNSSMHGFELLNNLLEWSRSQTGRIEFKPDCLRIKEVISSVTGLLQDTADKKKIELSIIDENDLTVWADSKMVGTVIRNLVTNALKFTRPGGRIIISCMDNQDYARLSVEDNGIGIDKAKLEHFFRIDTHFSTPGTENERGTGLGLLLCREFIERHGGEIRVESEPGKGSKFSFSLPKHKIQTVDIQK
ncbi:MAG: hybrid sensor histidine kinase/response regulator [Bacteroidales bacterium]|nr:hybrid sensor histidine kinase/response regulator [Bacteroidales bacterium]